MAIRSVGLQPLIEYHADIAVGDGDQTLYNALKSSVPGDRLTSRSAQWITLGVRLRPVAGLVLDAGLDIGLASPGFIYGPPVPAWNIVAGAAYAYDPAARSPSKIQVVTKTITREIVRGPVVGKIRGIVRDATTKKPLSNTTVRYTNRREAPQLSSEDGTFVSYGFVPGPVTMEVARENYDTAKIEASAIANGETPIDVQLTPKPPAAGTVHGRVADATGSTVQAAVHVTSASGAVIEAEQDSTGFSAKLPPGDYAVVAEATGFLAKQKMVNVSAGQLLTVDVVLPKKPAIHTNRLMRS